MGQHVLAVLHVCMPQRQRARLCCVYSIIRPQQHQGCACPIIFERCSEYWCSQDTVRKCMRCQAYIHCACDPVSDDGPHASHTYRMPLNTAAVAPPPLTPPQTVRRAVRWEYVVAMGARHGLCVVQAKPAWAHLCCSQTERCNARVHCRTLLRISVSVQAGCGCVQGVWRHWEWC